MSRTTRSNSEAPLPSSILSDYQAVRRQNRNTEGTNTSNSGPIVITGSTEVLNDSDRTETIEIEVALDSESDIDFSDQEMGTPLNQQNALSNTSASNLAVPSTSTPLSTTDDLFNHRQQIEARDRNLRSKDAEINVLRADIAAVDNQYQAQLTALEQQRAQKEAERNQLRAQLNNAQALVPQQVAPQATDPDRANDIAAAVHQTIQLLLAQNLLNAAAVQAPQPGPNVPEITQDRDEALVELTDCITNLTAALLGTYISQIRILTSSPRVDEAIRLLRKSLNIVQFDE